MLTPTEVPPLVVQLGWTLLHSTWQCAAVAAAYALAHSLVRERGPELRYRLSIGALLLMAAAPVVTFLWLDGGAPALAPDAAALAVAPLIVGGNVPDPDWLTRVQMTIEPWLPGLVVLWVIGVVLMSSRLWTSWQHLVALRRSAVLLEGGELKAMVVLLRSRLGIDRVVRVARSTLVESPTVVGWLQPMILVPTAALTGLSPTQLAMILAHELAHIQRQDYLVNVLQTLLETLMFYHPAVRWVSERARHEREECCDRLAVQVCGDPLSYARALAELEELRGLQYAWNLGAAGGVLLERIQRLLGTHPKQQRGAVWFASSLGLAVMTSVVATVGAPYLAEPRLEAGSVVAIEMLPNGPAPDLAPPPVRPPSSPVVETQPWRVPRAMPRDAMPPINEYMWRMPSFDAPAIALADASDEPDSMPIDAAGVGPNLSRATPTTRDPRLTGGAIVVSGEPGYPHRALRRGIEGHVVVEFTVDGDGVPRDPRVVAAAPYDMFENAALKAVSRTRFEPFRLDGMPVEQRVKQYIAFNIANGTDCEPVTGTRLCKPIDRLGPRSRGVEVYVIR